MVGRGRDAVGARSTGDALAAWLVARTGQAIEERDDGTLVTFADDEAGAQAARSQQLRGESPIPAPPPGSGRSTGGLDAFAGATGWVRGGSAA